MPQYTLTLLDTPGIQPYIFASNRLRESIGASELVRLATTVWPRDVLRATCRCNVAGDDARIEDGDLDAEVIYVGGGNCLILFRELERARRFATALSRKLHEAAPGLEMAAVHVPVDWESDSLQEQVAEAHRQLAQAKATAPKSAPLAGLGVTAACQSTGLVATRTSADYHPSRTDEAPYPISDAVAAKLAMSSAAQERLIDLFPEDVKRAGFEFPLDLDQFSRSVDEMSYIAVVHADGNRMGEHFKRASAGAASARDYVTRMRTASADVEGAAMSALQRTLSALVCAVRDEGRDGHWVGSKDYSRVPMVDMNLPFRPLVFGGDDVTFVCDGRLGLTLAAHYLEAFEEEAQNLDGSPKACAGVAVVKRHYPFARAYELSQQLTQSAKHLSRRHADASALDWHFAASGLLGTLDEMREREYKVDGGSLAQRPLRLRADGRDGWPGFVGVVDAFVTQWRDRRNKVMTLREALRGGTEATRTFLKSYNEGLPELEPSIHELQESGWSNGRCGFFDAIEAMDFYVPLKGGSHGDV